MTAPRPVEPVVGMEFYFRGEAALHTIKSITNKRVYYVFAAEGGAMFYDRSSLYYWTRSQEYGDVRPVLWTVGTKDDEGEVKVRLGVLDLLLDALPRFAKVCGCRSCGTCVALWPTRAAALAAGKAFGWSEPVARRVVRK